MSFDPIRDSRPPSSGTGAQGLAHAPRSLRGQGPFSQTMRWRELDQIAARTDLQLTVSATSATRSRSFPIRANARNNCRRRCSAGREGTAAAVTAIGSRVFPLIPRGSHRDATHDLMPGTATPTSASCSGRPGRSRSRMFSSTSCAPGSHATNSGSRISRAPLRSSCA